jgi:O-antigen/teichoic acid export membrane protein
MTNRNSVNRRPGQFRLRDSRLLLRNIVVTIGGTGLPSLLALLVLPFLIRELGAVRFGLLALIWTVANYLPLFDIGLGSAVTRRISREIVTEPEGVRASFWTALLTAFTLGTAAGLVLAMTAPWLVHLIADQSGLRREATLSLMFLAVGMPFIVANASVAGLLKAHQRFGLVTLIESPASALTYLAPLIVALFTPNVAMISATLATVKAAVFLAFVVTAMRAFPNLGGRPHIDLSRVKDLLKFGGWLTFSSFTAPLLLELDRFLIAGIVSVKAVGLYAFPFELATAGSFIPATVGSVFYPALASTTGSADDTEVNRLVRRLLQFMMCFTLPVLLVFSVLARPIMQFLMGSQFHAESFGALQYLVVGVFFNSLARVPYTLLMSAGRTAAISFVHLSELPLYIGLSAWLISSHGIVGAAVAWMLRTAADLVLFTGVVHRLRLASTLRRMVSWSAVTGGIAVFAAIAPSDGAVRAILASVGAVLVLVMASWVLLDQKDRSVAATYLRGLRARASSR